ncbi:hypothetical protein KGY73_02145 [bacterium]|nr:hypothetical protein [bacterium]
MNIGVLGVIIIFGLFIIVLILNPKLSCFGRIVRSPLYPLFRKKKAKKKEEDYGFSLVDEKNKSTEKGQRKSTHGPKNHST